MSDSGYVEAGVSKGSETVSLLQLLEACNFVGNGYALSLSVAPHFLSDSKKEWLASALIDSLDRIHLCKHRPSVY